MIQEVIASLIVLFAIIFAIWKLNKSIFGKNKKSNSFCSGCSVASYCKLRDIKEKHRPDCHKPIRKAV